MNDKSFSMMLVGVGGGGCRFASSAVRAFDGKLPAIGFDCDAIAARNIDNMRCMILGAQRYDGHGTGGDSVKGRTAVQDDVDTVTTALTGVRLAVVVTALGGGVGNGATPAILNILRNVGAHTLCLATRPFALEGPERMAQAERALPLIEEASDALSVISMDHLYAAAGTDEPLADAIPRAEAIFSSALTLFWRLIQTPGFITLDAASLLTVLSQGKGRCRFAVASAAGASRSAEVVAGLCSSPLLGKSPQLKEVQAVTLGVLAGSDLRLAELSDISKHMQAALSPGCEWRLGTVLDERYAGEIHMVALLFDVLRTKGAHSAASSEGVSVGVASGLVGDVRPTARRPRGKTRSRAIGRELFKDVEATLINGEDLDRPSYLRQGIVLDR